MKKLVVVIGSSFSSLIFEGEALSVEIDNNNILIIKDEGKPVASLKSWVYWVKYGYAYWKD